MSAMRMAGATSPGRDHSHPRQYQPAKGTHVRVEICVESLAGVRSAARAGADRAELCDNLAVGGTTPSIGAVEAAVLAAAEQVEARRLALGPAWSALPEAAPFGVQVMIRPRGGDFVFDQDERHAMMADVRRIARLSDELADYTRPVPTSAAGRDLPPAVELGFVIGALTPEGKVDRGLVRLLADTADGAPVTFHKAIDCVPDIEAAYRSLLGLGVHRVLTSGGIAAKENALRGAKSLARLVELSRSDAGPGVIVAGGVRTENAAELIATTGTDEIHLRCPLPNLPHDVPQATDEDEVHRIAKLVQAIKR
ncbi:CutC-like protein M6_Spy0363 [Actinomyces bovis]|uniref:PF03932 family protein CutC n=1 Tax=Actinomyces bovis TaxID=1658 RepID=A0ABY1VPP4_9ACTO|nr:copper homeostasis protein CutC [Actinomyces bovis]SPT53601.1 CutC-like protein M6_Spy0363 [Actinomyces bovis]VEG55633.1 CutC-like protein M6_Spy0363 [Actinomyces israelii]